MKYIISVGGSLIVPSKGIDINFLKSLRSFILERLIKGDKFVIVAGGGSTARNYVRAATSIESIPVEEQDWLGIHATRLNAHLIKTVLREVAHPEIITNPSKSLKIESPVIVASGYRPGCSTDYVAVLLAKKYKAKKIINLSNIDQVYNKDPKKFPGAKAIEKISWPDFRKIVGSKWLPGMNAPFDPIASILAAELGLEVVVMNGKKFKNINNYIENKDFVGTTIYN